MTYLTALLTCAALVMAMQTHQSAIAVADDDTLIATVNGQKILQHNLIRYGQLRLGLQANQSVPPDKKSLLIEELINQALIHQDAVATGFDKSPELQAEITAQIRNIITQNRLKQLIEEEHPPTPAQLQTAYQQQILTTASNEYQASHILLETKTDAQAVIAVLDTGKNFAELAKQKSTGPSSSVGGDLGWFSPNQMVKPFSDAVAKLNKGQYTKHPVKTQFGWHIIQLVDSRKIEPPPFEKVEDQLRNVVNNQIISDYLNKLKQNAKIEKVTAQAP